MTLCRRDQIARRQQRLTDLFTWLSSMADAGDACPRNDDIAERFGVSIVTAAGFVRSLENEGVIHVARFHKDRVVTIIATGRSTAAPKASARRHWSDRGVIKSKPAKSRPVPIAARQVIMAPVLPSPVHRDPCLRCGTRRDIGCRHYPLEARP